MLPIAGHSPNLLNSQIIKEPGEAKEEEYYTSKEEYYTSLSKSCQTELLVEASNESRGDGKCSGRITLPAPPLLRWERVGRAMEETVFPGIELRRREETAWEAFNQSMAAIGSPVVISGTYYQPGEDQG